MESFGLSATFDRAFQNVGLLGMLHPASTKTMIDFQPESTGLGSYKGTYIRFGVREHGMGAIANGLHAYGGIIPFVATFLVSLSSSAKIPL